MRSSGNTKSNVLEFVCPCEFFCDCVRRCSLVDPDTGTDSLWRWLYDAFRSNVPELQLAVLLLVPSLARAHLCRAMSRKPLAGFEAVLLALYAHAASQHGAGEVETRDHVTPEPGKDFGTSKREPVGKIEQVQSIGEVH